MANAKEPSPLPANVRSEIEADIKRMVNTPIRNLVFETVGLEAPGHHVRFVCDDHPDSDSLEKLRDAGIEEHAMSHSTDNTVYSPWRVIHCRLEKYLSAKGLA